MKAVIFITVPTILLIVGCIILNTSWPYYIIAWAAGNGIGALALLTWWQVKDSSEEPKIKIEDEKKL
jgi:hypothetical protein